MRLKKASTTSSLGKTSSTRSPPSVKSRAVPNRATLADAKISLSLRAELYANLLTRADAKGQLPPEVAAILVLSGLDLEGDSSGDSILS